MAKHPLFGKHEEPRCETCAQGQLSPDKQSVLCRYSGSAPLDHHCRRYTYDPLRRTPRRAKKPETPDAKAFSLDDAPSFAPPESDTYHRRMMGNLRTYLDENSNPDVDTILSILHANTPDNNGDLFCEAAATAPAHTQNSSALLFSADDSDDIFDDLQRLTEMTLLTTDDSDDNADDDAMPPLDGDSLLFGIDTPEVDDEPLSVDDLLLIAKEATQEDPSYATPPVIPDDALSISCDDTIEDEYATPMPIPDSALPILNNKEHDTYDD